MGKPVSIDSMKSTINRHGGIARGNRYAVYISHPSKGMNALLRFDPATFLNNLISGDGVHVGDFINDPRDLFIMCQSVSLPGKRISTMEADHNHNSTKKPYSATMDEVSMTFMLTNDYYIKKYFDLWQEMIIDTTHSHYTTSYKRDYCSDIIIQQLSTSNHIIPGYTLMLENAYPIQTSGIELGNGADGLMDFSVTWEYDKYRTINNFDVDVNLKLSINDDGLLEKLNKDKKFDQYRNEEGPPDTTTKNNPFKRQPIADGL
jgi:hypothetical protein